MAGINHDDEDEIYVNIPGHLECEVLSKCLSSHFDDKMMKDEKQPKFMKQYKEWLLNTTSPSAKVIYNTMRKLTPIIKRDKNIIFTITKGYGVYYRIKKSYLEALCITIFKDNPEILQMIDTLANNEAKSEEVDSIKDNRSEESMVVCEGTIDIDTASIEEVVEDMNKMMERESKFLKKDLKDTYKDQDSHNDIAISVMIKEAIAAEIPHITATIRKEFDILHKTNIDDIHAKIAKMEMKVEAHHKQMESTLEKSRKMSDTLRHRTHYCNEKLKEVMSKVDNATAEVNTTIEDLVELKSENIVDKLNDTMEMAERDIAATMITFHKTVKTQTALVPEHNHGNEYVIQCNKLEELHGLYKAKLDKVETQIQLNTENALVQMDAILITKMADLERDAEEKKENLTQFFDALKNKIPKTVTSRPPDEEEMEQERPDSSAQTYNTRTHFHHPTIQNPYKRNTEATKPSHGVRNNVMDGRHRYSNGIPTVNTEYLRKNVKHKCLDKSQVLDFYMKLRTTVKGGGIYMKEIEHITLEDTIMEQTHGAPDYMLQSNALYTILANEDIIPSEYVEAQNKIMSRNNTQDGFAAMKAILMTVHPSLTRKPPPITPPMYSTHGDISLYEQAVRNFFLIQYLYNGHSHTELQKTQQFLRGLDDESYASAIQRVVNQIDNVRNFGGKVPEQYTITAISGTIQNMNEYGQTFTPTVNVMQRMKRRGDHAHSSSDTSYKPKSTTRKKLVNAQCSGCKTFGHKLIDCSIIGKVLAIMELADTHPGLCKKILSSHISKNDPSKRMAVIRSLQQCEVLPNDMTVEEGILDEKVNETVECTINAADGAITAENSNYMME